MSAPPSILASQLFFLRYGYALWIPESKDREVHIGDVGYLSEDGGFNIIFNCAKPQHDTINNPHGVPRGHNLFNVQSAGFVEVDLITQGMVNSRTIRKHAVRAEGQVLE